MASKVLFYSSIGSTILHFLLFTFFSTFPHPHLYYGCLATSIWNHGTTSLLAKLADRVMVVLCVIHHFYWLSFSVSTSYWAWCGISITINGAFFYVFSKTFENRYVRITYHFISHLLATFSSFCLAMSSSSGN